MCHSIVVEHKHRRETSSTIREERNLSIIYIGFGILLIGCLYLMMDILRIGKKEHYIQEIKQEESIEGYFPQCCTRCGATWQVNGIQKEDYLCPQCRKRKE